jgi:hypothetical protein
LYFSYLLINRQGLSTVIPCEFLKQTEVDETVKKYWLFFENEIVNDRMNAKYNSLVSKDCLLLQAG